MTCSSVMCDNDKYGTFTIVKKTRVCYIYENVLVVFAGAGEVVGLHGVPAQRVAPQFHDHLQVPQNTFIRHSYLHKTPTFHTTTPSLQTQIMINIHFQKKIFTSLLIAYVL